MDTKTRMIPLWIAYSVAALLFWGLWAFLPKVAARTLDDTSILCFYFLGSAGMTLGMLARAGFKLHFEPSGFVWAVLAGVCAIAGLLYFLRAVELHRPSVVVVFTSLYPMVTLALNALILKEKLSPLQCVGIFIALTGLALICYAPATPSTESGTPAQAEKI